MLFQAPCCRAQVVGERAEVSMPRNRPRVCQRCSEPLGSPGGSLVPPLFPESPEAAAGASCSHPIQDAHPPEKKPSVKVEYSLGQTPRMLGGQNGHWRQPLSSPGHPLLTYPSTTPWCKEGPQLGPLLETSHECARKTMKDRGARAC